jgi:hypothetical protein
MHERAVDLKHSQRHNIRVVSEHGFAVPNPRRQE